MNDDLTPWTHDMGSDVTAFMERKIRASWIVGGFLLCMMLSGLAGFVSLYVVILFGPQQLHAHPRWRWFVLVSGLLAVVVAGGLFVKTYAPGYPMLNIGLWILIGPFIVGLRYLPSLVRRPATAPEPR